LIGLVAWAPAAGAESLSEAFIEAYVNNPTLRAEQAALRATDEGLPQALSGWRPSVSLTTQYGKNTRDSNNFLGSRVDTLTPFNSRLTITQPLYRGGQTVAATRAAEADIRSGRARLLTVEQSVMLDVVTAYMNVLREQAVVQLKRNNEQRLQRQLEAAQDRFRVGEITRTDVAQAEARLSRAESDRVEAEGNLVASRASYQRIVGRQPGRLDPPPPLPKLPKAEAEAMATAIDGNPDLVAARELAAAAEAGIRAASGALLPSVSLDGTFSHNEDTSLKNDSSKTAQILARLVVPLYQTGSVYSQVREQRQVYQQRRVQVLETERRVREGVTQAWENLTTARSQLIANRKEAEANKIALDGVIQEAQVGSRTTLDVLDAEQELLDAQVALVQTERNEYVAAFQLLAAVGLMTARDLNLPVDVYDASSNTERVRYKFFGTDGGLD